jgi:hypothetical protein
MSHIFDATITFAGTDDIPTTSHIKDIPAASAPDLTKLLGVATSIKSHVNAGIRMYTLLDWEERIINPITTAAGVNSDKAFIDYEYVPTGGARQYGRFVLPNPNVPTHFEDLPGEGFRMLEASRAALATLLSTASGLTITVTEGKLGYQDGQRNRGKSGSCIEFSDSVGGQAYMGFPVATSADALVTLAGALDSGLYSLSQVTCAYFLTKTFAIPDPTSGIGLAEDDADDIKFSTCETRANMKFYYLDGGQKKYMSFLLPSIKNSDCVRNGPRSGWKVRVPVGDGIALSLTAMFGSANRQPRYIRSKIKVKNIRSF